MPLDGLTIFGLGKETVGLTKLINEFWKGKSFGGAYQAQVNDLLYELNDRVANVEKKLLEMGKKPVEVNPIQGKEILFGFGEAISTAVDDFQKEALLNVYAGFVNPDGGSFSDRQYWVERITKLKSFEASLLGMIGKHKAIITIENGIYSLKKALGDARVVKEKDLILLTDSKDKIVMIQQLIAEDKQQYFKRGKNISVAGNNGKSYSGGPWKLSTLGELLYGKMTDPMQ